MPNPVPIAKSFKGLKNDVDPARIELNLETAMADCSESVNVKYDDTGRPRMRKGQVPMHMGSFHSIWSVLDTIGYVGLSDSIYKLNLDLSITGVRSGLTGDRICFCWTPIGVYYANGMDKGILKDDRSFPWVMGTPRDTSHRYYAGPPRYAKHIELFANRLFVSQGEVVYRSEPNDYSLFQMRDHFNFFPGPVRMIKAVAGGVYFSDDKHTYFAQGNDPKDWVRRTVMECPAMEFSAVPELISPKNIGMEGDDGWACWVSQEGLVFGSPQGNIFLPTKDRIKFPSGFHEGSAVMDGHNCIYNMHQ